MTGTTMMIGMMTTGKIEDIAPAGKDGTYELENISSMDIELNYDELILQEYDGKNVKVSISGDYTDKVRVTTEGTELKIESKGKTSLRKDRWLFAIRQEWNLQR